MPKPSKEELTAAAAILKEAEVDALNALQAVFDAHDEALAEIEASLPSDLPNSAAKRLVQEARAQLSYKRTMEVPNALRPFLPPDPLPGVLP